MSDLPAQHYLKIYRQRVSMAERGVTTPAPEVLDDMRRLVAGLARLDPQAEVRLETDGPQASFKAAATNELIAEFDFTPCRP